MLISVYPISQDILNPIEVYGCSVSTSNDEKWLILFDESDDEENIVVKEIGRFKWDEIIGYSIEGI